MRFSGRVIFEALGSLFKKPNTVLYPAQKVPKAPGFAAG